MPLSCALTVALALCGCDQLFGSPTGSKGSCATTFQWAGCPGANWCASTTALAVGASAHLRTAEGCGWTAVSTSNPAVATATLLAADEVVVTAVGGGPVNLVLTGTSTTSTTLPLTITAPTSLIAEGGFTATAGPVVLANNGLRFHAYPVGGSQPLVGVGNIVYTGSGVVLSASTSDPSGGVTFAGPAGNGTITATLGGISLTVPVAIAGDSQVTNVYMVPQQQSDAASGNASLILDVTVYAGTTSVYVLPCQWQVSPGSLAQVSTAGGTFAAGTPTTRYQFSGNPGSYVLSCDIAGRPREFMVQL